MCKHRYRQIFCMLVFYGEDLVLEVFGELDFYEFCIAYCSGKVLPELQVDKYIDTDKQYWDFIVFEETIFFIQNEVGINRHG